MSTRDKIIDIAESLFAQFGYNAVSMRTIAEKVDTTKAALYYHFASKLDLLKDMLERAFSLYKEGLQDVLDKNSESFEDQLRESIIYCLKFSSKQSNLINFLQKSSIQDKKVSLIIEKIKKEMLDIWEQMIKNVIKLHIHDKNFDPKLTTILVLGMVNTFVNKNIISSKEKIKYDYEVIADRIMSFVISTKQKVT